MRMVFGQGALFFFPNMCLIIIFQITVLFWISFVSDKKDGEKWMKKERGERSHISYAAPFEM